MKTMDEIQQEIIEEFSLFEDWMSKYEYIIDLGKKLEPMPEEYKTDEYLIKGCASRAWLYPKFKDGKIHFYADGDAIISKGFLYLILRVVNDRTPEEILNNDLYFIDKIGLSAHLSPTRANGLAATLNYIKKYAQQFSKQ